MIREFIDKTAVLISRIIPDRQILDIMCVSLPLSLLGCVSEKPSLASNLSQVAAAQLRSLWREFDAERESQ